MAWRMTAEGGTAGVPFFITVSWESPETDPNRRDQPEEATVRQPCLSWENSESPAMVVTRWDRHEVQYGQLAQPVSRAAANTQPCRQPRRRSVIAQQRLGGGYGAGNGRSHRPISRPAEPGRSTR